MKSLIKLALAGLVTYAAWNAGNVWLDYIKLKDAVSEAAQFGTKLSDDDLRSKVVDIGQQHGIAFSGDVNVRRENNHTLVDASYTEPVNILPWYAYPWTFDVHVDTMVLGGLK